MQPRPGSALKAGRVRPALQQAAARLSPHTSLSFARAETQGMQKAPAAGEARVSPSLRTYAGRFSEHTDGRSERVFRLLPSPIPLEGMGVLDAESLLDVLKTGTAVEAGPLLHPFPEIPRLAQRREIVHGLLGAWTAELSAAQTTIASSGSLAAIGALPTVLSHCLPRGDAASHRNPPRGAPGDSSGALSKASEMLSGCMDFVKLLEAKAESGT